MHYALCSHYALCTMHYALSTMHYALCTMHYAALCTMHYARTMHYALCTMHYARTMHYALCSHYALCTMHYALCTMHYALCTMYAMHYALCTMYAMHYALCTMHALSGRYLSPGGGGFSSKWDGRHHTYRHGGWVGPLTMWPDSGRRLLDKKFVEFQNYQIWKHASILIKAKCSFVCVRTEKRCYQITEKV